MLHGDLVFLELPLFAAESDHGAHGIQALLDDGGSNAIPALSLHLHRPHCPARQEEADENRDQDGQEHQGKHPTHGESCDVAAKEAADGHDAGGHLVPERLCHDVDVAGDLVRKLSHLSDIVPTHILAQHRLEVEHTHPLDHDVAEDLETSRLKRGSNHRANSEERQVNAHLPDIIHHVVGRGRRISEAVDERAEENGRHRLRAAMCHGTKHTNRKDAELNGRCERQHGPA
mmetsp:Transcript_17625/g.48374  ORF Transcript_17625/g.48374 Transcript_17625/m.48374 type:complete len:231 (+) Transcript_17625:512-1204(+)